MGYSTKPGSDFGRAIPMHTNGTYQPPDRKHKLDVNRRLIPKNWSFAKDVFVEGEFADEQLEDLKEITSTGNDPSLMTKAVLLRNLERIYDEVSVLKVRASRKDLVNAAKERERQRLLEAKQIAEEDKNREKQVAAHQGRLATLAELEATAQRQVKVRSRSTVKENSGMMAFESAFDAFEVGPTERELETRQIRRAVDTGESYNGSSAGVETTTSTGGRNTPKKKKTTPTSAASNNSISLESDGSIGNLTSDDDEDFNNNIVPTKPKKKLW